MKTLTLEQLLGLHVLVISETGGSQGLRELSRLESAIASQTQSVFGDDVFATLHQKAAAMARGIVADHPFVDGNKRTAMLTALTFLQCNGQKFTAKQGELEDFAVLIATDHLSVDYIAQWLETHCK